MLPARLRVYPRPIVRQITENLFREQSQWKTGDLVNRIVQLHRAQGGSETQTGRNTNGSGLFVAVLRKIGVDNFRRSAHDSARPLHRIEDRGGLGIPRVEPTPTTTSMSPDPFVCQRAASGGPSPSPGKQPLPPPNHETKNRPPPPSPRAPHGKRVAPFVLT